MKHYLFILLCLLSQLATAQTKETYPYAERDSTLYLDVHRPAVARADKATVLSVFGGGFYVGRRDDKLQQKIADSLTKRGFTVINIDYRLGLRDTTMVKKCDGLFEKEDLFRYCIDIATEDCAAAIQWAVTHADEIDINPSKIVLTGSSAGAITVLQLDYSRCNGIPINLPHDWRPAAVVAYAGGIMCKRNELLYFNTPAPTLLLHGIKDKIVNYRSFGLPFGTKLFGSSSIDRLMDQNDIPHWTIRFENVGHEVASWFPGSVDLFCAFVDQCLSGRISNLDATMTDEALKPTKFTEMTIFELYKK